MHSSLSGTGRSSTQGAMTEPMSLLTMPHCLPDGINTDGLGHLDLVVWIKKSLQIPTQVGAYYAHFS